VALIGQQRLEQVTYFRFVQRADVAAQRQRVAVGDRGADMGEEGGADDAVVVIDRGCFRRVGGRAGGVLLGRQIARFVQDRLPCRFSFACSGSGH
jgi:hypothetical protein